MRLHVPPRDVASTLIVRAITRAAWATAALLLLGAAVMVFDVFASRGQHSAALAPIGFIVAQLAALALLSLRPRARTAVTFIVVSLVCIMGYQLALFAAEPSVTAASEYLANRPIVAVCAIGAATGQAIDGIRWSSAAFLLGEAASVCVQLWTGRPLALGVGPLLAWFLIVMLMVWLWRSSRNQFELLPDARSIDEETLRLESEQDAEARAAAVIHDTVLSDLAAIVHGRVVLTEHDRQHLRDDVSRLRAAMAASGEEVDSGSVDSDLLRIITDLQWRGLSVELSGNNAALSLLSRQARTAALNAIRAALENVLKHAGTASADLFIDESPEEVTVMIVDEGVGFDARAVRKDRLGLRLSIITRVEDCGGRASVWSEPDVGTSVVLALPRTNRGDADGT